MIKKINGKPGKYEKKFKKIKFASDDNLPLNKILKLYNSTIVPRPVFEEDSKNYRYIFLDECLHEL